MGGFNPRARMGRDCSTVIRRCPIRCFNPRARMGRDKRKNKRKQKAMFQPTRPHGARLDGTKTKIDASIGFNPRARMGRDVLLFLSLYLGWYGFNPRARMGRD